MTTKKFTVNSLSALDECLKDIADSFVELKYINVTLSDKRSLDQNALKEVWYRDIAKCRQDVSVNEVRRECKLKHGVPILRRDSEINNWLYQKSLDLLPYEKQLILMDEKSGFAVTSAMSTAQMQEYLNEVNLEYPFLESKKSS